MSGLATLGSRRTIRHIPNLHTYSNTNLTPRMLSPCTNSEDSLPTCAICIQPCDAPCQRSTTLPCNHKFHTVCISQWHQQHVHQRSDSAPDQQVFVPCPLCRALFARHGDNRFVAPAVRQHPPMFPSHHHRFLYHQREPLPDDDAGGVSPLLYPRYHEDLDFERFVSDEESKTVFYAHDDADMSDDDDFGSVDYPEDEADDV